MENIQQFLQTQNKTRATSERASVIEFFVENLRDKSGKKYSPRFLGFKVSHLSLQDLYYLKSCCLDYEHRTGEMGKYFFGSLKVKK